MVPGTDGERRRDVVPVALAAQFGFMPRASSGLNRHRLEGRHWVRRRDRVLSADEIEKLWTWLHSDAMPPVPCAILQLQLLTGARCGEIAGMTAEEIDDLGIESGPARLVH